MTFFMRDSDTVRWIGVGYRVADVDETYDRTILEETTRVISPSSLSTVLNMAKAWAGDDATLVALADGDNRWAVHGVEHDGKIFGYWVTYAAAHADTLGDIPMLIEHAIFLYGERRDRQIAEIMELLKGDPWRAAVSIDEVNA